MPKPPPCQLTPVLFCGYCLEPLYSPSRDKGICPQCRQEKKKVREKRQLQEKQDQIVRRMYFGLCSVQLTLQSYADQQQPPPCYVLYAIERSIKKSIIQAVKKLSALKISENPWENEQVRALTGLPELLRGRLRYPPGTSQTEPVEPEEMKQITQEAYRIVSEAVEALFPFVPETVPSTT